jgi:arylsulfatase A-like enzyme
MAHNILLLVIDCLRADFVNERGLAHTPAIDRLVAQGFSFTSALAATTTTTPSFASLLTGRYPFENGVRSHSGYRLNPAVPTLPEVLREGGYHTRAEVCGPLGPEVGLDRGFERYHLRDRSEGIHREWGRRLLEDLPGEREAPWFLLLHVWALHRRRQVLPECNDSRHGDTDYARAFASIDVYLARLLERLPEDTLIVLTGDHGEEIARSALHRRVGRLRRKLFRFAHKHGLTRTHMSRGLRGLREGHGHSLYDELVLVPLVFHGPGLIPPGRSDVQVRHVDVLPTLTEAGGVPTPDGTTGQSLMGIMREGGGEHRDAYLEAVGTTLPDKNEWLAGLRVANRYKYIYAPYRGGFQPELYDLRTDSGERRNLAALLPAVAADLRARIERLGAGAMTGSRMDAAEQEKVMARLRDLGYADGPSKQQPSG